MSAPASPDPGPVPGVPVPPPDARARVRRAAVVGAALNPADLLALVAHPASGGQALFVGTVRDHDQGRAVTGLDYEAHPDAEQALRRVAEQVAAGRGVRAVAVEHRTGCLHVGDVAVVVAVAAEHRDEAFAACRALIDTLKEQVPIWKRQHHPDGTSSWVHCG